MSSPSNASSIPDPAFLLHKCADCDNHADWINDENPKCFDCMSREDLIDRIQELEAEKSNIINSFTKADLQIKYNEIKNLNEDTPVPDSLWMFVLANKDDWDASIDGWTNLESLIEKWEEA
jgi:hypothetical protein